MDCMIVSFGKVCGVEIPLLSKEGIQGRLDKYEVFNSKSDTESTLLQNHPRPVLSKEGSFRMG